MIESGKGHAAPSSTQFAIIREDVMRGKKQAIDSITLQTAALLFSFFSTSSTFFPFKYLMIFLVSGKILCAYLLLLVG